MDIGRIILNQILIMFILMAIGYVLYKKEWINDFGTKQMCTILMYICTPCIIVSAFEKEFNVNREITLVERDRFHIGERPDNFRLPAFYIYSLVNQLLAAGG